MSSFSLNRILLLLTVFALLAGTTMPGEVKSQIEGQLWAGVPWSGMGHFVLFVALAACLTFDRQLASWRRMIPLLVLLAASSELLQFLAHDRHPKWLDIGIDLSGAMVGWLILRATAINPLVRERHPAPPAKIDPVLESSDGGPPSAIDAYPLTKP